MIHFIVNNASNSGRSRIDWITLEKKLNDNALNYIINFCNRNNTVSDICKQINTNDTVIAVGGDGTINTIINEILLQHLDVYFTVLPDGTGNDWVKTHQLSTDADALLERLKNKNIFHHDVGKIEYGDDYKKVFYFVNMLGIGYSGTVVEILEQKKSYLKSKMKYTLASVIALKDLKNYKTDIQIDNKEVHENLTELNISICKYGGGGMLFAPEATGNSGYFHVASVSDFNALKFMMNTRKLFSGTYLKLKEVKSYQAKTVQLKKVKMLMQADGELLGNSPMHVSLLSKYLKVLV